MKGPSKKKRAPKANSLKIVVEKHSDGFVAYPLGLKGVVVGEGGTYDEALADVKSAIRFHVSTFGKEVLEGACGVLEAFVAEAEVGGMMAKFPVDAPKQRVLKTLAKLGFHLVREREHLSLVRTNSDGTWTPLTIPNHARIKGSTLRAICTQAGISRSDFLRAFGRA